MKKKPKIIKGWAVVCSGYNPLFFLCAFDNKTEAESEILLKGHEVCLRGDAIKLHKVTRCEIKIKV